LPHIASAGRWVSYPTIPSRGAGFRLATIGPTKEYPFAASPGSWRGRLPRLGGRHASFFQPLFSRSTRRHRIELIFRPKNRFKGFSPPLALSLFGGISFKQGLPGIQRKAPLFIRSRIGLKFHGSWRQRIKCHWRRGLDGRRFNPSSGIWG